MLVLGLLQYPFGFLRHLEIWGLQYLLTLLIRLLVFVRSRLPTETHEVCVNFSQFPFHQISKNDAHPLLQRVSVLLDEHNTLKSENADLRHEITLMKSDFDRLSHKFQYVQSQLERANETKQVLDLCKLLLAGSIVPVASALLVYFLADGSLFVPSL